MNARRISPVGFSREIDILDAAQQQDRERRIREDDEHFRRTGENREPIEEAEFLVPIGGHTPIVADEIQVDDVPQRGYIEEAPTRLIDSIRTQSRPITTPEREAYLKRQRELENKKMNEMLEKCKKKFNNPITGLEV